METFFEANPGFKSHLVSALKIAAKVVDLSNEIFRAETDFLVLFETESFEETMVNGRSSGS